jgi:hypothetical protein
VRSTPTRSPNAPPSEQASRRHWTAVRITALGAHGVRAARPPKKPLSQHAIQTSHFSLLTSFPLSQNALLTSHFSSLSNFKFQISNLRSRPRHHSRTGSNSLTPPRLRQGTP